MPDKFVTIKDCPFYEVNIKGVVRNKRTGYILKSATAYNGAKVVTISNYDGKQKQMVHRLIAEAFMPNFDPRLRVYHINGDQEDNRLENFAQQGFVPMAAAPDMDVKILDTGEVFSTPEEAAARVNGTKEAVLRVLRGQQRRHRDMRFIYIPRKK